MSTRLPALYDDHVRIQRERTDDALQACGFDALAIFAGRPTTRFLDDQPYPFKPNPHFKLWAPLSECADCWIVYRPHTPLKLVFVQPIDYWHKPPPVPVGDWTRHFTIEVIRNPDDARSHVSALAHCAFIGERQPQFEDWGFAAVNPQKLLDRLHFARANKTAYELECLRQASQRAARGHLAAERAFREGASEYAIQMQYLNAAEHTELELPYPNIVGLNENAAVLHYQHQQRQAPKHLRSLLIDAGAEFRGYASDITRTYAAAPGEFADLISAMDELQQTLCRRVRPGVDYVDIHLEAHRLIAALLRAHGIIRLTGDDAVASGLSKVFFPHGVGHLLGLQVHDVGGFTADRDGTQRLPPPEHPYLRLTRRLEPGFVVTIEPGLYFIDPLLREAHGSAHAQHIDWERVEALRPYGGIRIEDDVACSADGPENLTRGAFAALVGE